MVDPLLALCARAVSHPEQLRRLVTQAQIYTNWSSLPRKAESIALAPLTYTHLQAANIFLPEDSRRALMALTLRHRRANRIRNSILAEILAAFKEEGIEVLVLKGAALASTVYPQPGLRPMRDIDILVRKRDALRAQMMLVDLGFQAIVPQSVDEYTTHHLPVAQREEDGLMVSVEVHFRLLPYTEHALTYEELITNATSFSVNEIAAKTLNYEDMLWHIYRHSFALPQIDQSIRLIWVADFVSVVEKYVDEIEWDLVKNRYPQIWHILPIFHYLTPWSENVLKTLQIDVTRPPKGVGQIPGRHLLAIGVVDLAILWCRSPLNKVVVDPPGATSSTHRQLGVTILAEEALELF